MPLQLEAIYIIASAFALFWISLIWSKAGWLNLTIKTLFAAIAFLGAIVVAKEFVI